MGEVAKQRTRADTALATLPSPEKLASAYQTLALKAHEIVREAQSRQSLAVALNGLATIRTMLDSIARLSGHFAGAPPATNVNVNINVEFKAAIVQEILATIPGTLDAPPPKLEKLIDAA